MEAFTSVSTYSQHLKSLSDKLINVGSPVTYNKLVIQLDSGLTEPYKGLFDALLEETDLARRAAQSSLSIIVARDSNVSQDIFDNSFSQRNTNGGKRNHYRNNDRSNNGC
ncbi:uncharacterized protein LOC107030167 [Solanum pennellii]|uniref:Uncharacterized protein LOC107030167 n=1 Tax=Solanum pennellii TaxID=28526 RepID=A0ABM1HL09_SOLPN|nr:uncharacterized protein LOC107030167 [Solanum pennellii]